MRPAISQVDPAEIPIAGGPIKATSTHTAAASRLAARARRTPCAWSASWYARSSSESTKRSVEMCRRSHATGNDTAPSLPPARSGVPATPDQRRAQAAVWMSRAAAFCAAGVPAVSSNVFWLKSSTI